MLDATTQSRLAKWSKFATRIPDETEFDRFAAYVECGATITGAAWYGVTAENNESERVFMPEGGLTEEHYRRLGKDHFDRRHLARGVIENLLKLRGHDLRVIWAGFWEIDDEALPDLVEEYSFEAMADAVETLIRPFDGDNTSPGRLTEPTPARGRSDEAEGMATALGREVEKRLGPPLKEVYEYLQGLAIDVHLSEIKAELSAQVRRRQTKERYTPKEVAEIVGKKEFTVREWCRLGRVNATKLPGGRGNEGEWRISHEELDRYRNEGLLRRGKY